MITLKHGGAAGADLQVNLHLGVLGGVKLAIDIGGEQRAESLAVHVSLLLVCSGDAAASSFRAILRARSRAR